MPPLIRQRLSHQRSTIHALGRPGILMDLGYDDKGDIDRESYLVEVKDGKQVVTETLPRLKL